MSKNRRPPLKFYEEQDILSPATAGTHVRNILRKAAVNTRTDLVLLATQGTEGTRARR